MNALEGKLEAMVITKLDRKTKQGKKQANRIYGTSDIKFKEQNSVQSTTRSMITQSIVSKLSRGQTTAEM